jgi:hypothetical protein
MALEPPVVACIGCSVKTPRIPLFVKCKGACGQHLHIRCAGLVDDYGVIKEGFVAKNWTCEKCVSLPLEEINGDDMESTKSKLDAILKRMDKMENAVSTLSQNQLSASSKSIQTASQSGTNQSNVTKKTWSSVASTSKQQQKPEEVTLEQSGNLAEGEHDWKRVEKKKRDENDIFVEPAKTEEAGDLRHSVVEALGDAARQHVRDIRRVNSGVVIRCNNEEGKKVVADKLKVASEKICLRQTAGNRTPRARLAVHGAYLEDFPRKDDLKADENTAYLLEELKANNLNGESVSVVAVYKKNPWGRSQRLDEMVTIILLVDKEAKDRLLQKGLLIGVKNCKVIEQDGPMTCFNCRGFGHTSKTCQNKKVCIRCAGDHLANDCNAEENEIKCVNCCNFNKKGYQEKMDENHKANSPTCESYQRAKAAWLGKSVKK